MNPNVVGRSFSDAMRQEQRSKRKKDGTCDLCAGHFKDVGKHKCPVSKCLNADPGKISQDAVTGACAGCETVYHTFNKHLSLYKGVLLCADCLAHPAIVAENEYNMTVLRFFNIVQGKSYCELCDAALLDTVTGDRLRAYHHDHRDALLKTANICDLLRQGASVEEICAEASKCRLLCVACHSKVTYAEMSTGYFNLRRVRSGMSDETLARCRASLEAVLSLL